MSRTINNLNNAQRINGNKYTMALQAAEAPAIGEQQVFPGLEDNADHQPINETEPVAENPEADLEKAAEISTLRSLGWAAVGLGIIFAVILSLRAFSVAHQDKGQTVKLAQIVARQNKDIKNLETVLLRMQAEQKVALEKMDREYKRLDKQVEKTDKGVTEMNLDTSRVQSAVDDIKTTQQQLITRIMNISRDVQSIKYRPE